MSPSSESFITEKDLSENRDAENELIDLVVSGESVALVGSGFSQGCGFPTWEELLNKLRDRADAMDPDWEYSPPYESLLDYGNDIHDCIVAARGGEAFGDEVGRIFRDAEQALETAGSFDPDIHGEPLVAAPRAGLQRFHLRLAGLPFRGILTTNYDHLLEGALVGSGRCSERPQPVPVYRGPPMLVSQAIRNLAVGDSPRYVVHLHGEYSLPATVILTGKQYSEAYGLENSHRSRLFNLLFGIMITRRLVFVGFGLRDPYIEKMLEQASVFEWSWGEPIHFAILPRSETGWPEEKKQASRLKKELGIQAVFYEARPDDYSDLHALIDRIHDGYSASQLEEPSNSKVASPVGAGRKKLPWVDKANRAAIAKVGDNED